ncbi:MAG: 4Fe-4S dicluster domain-containing protein, partial [Nitrospirae bacterium]
IEKSPGKYVMLPANARKRRVELEKRIALLKEYSQGFSGNRIEWGDRSRGFITSGICYQYVKEVFPEASVLKLGMTWPLPEGLIREFADSVDEVIVVEELDPFLETHIKALGIRCRGKEIIPSIGELSPNMIKRSVIGEDANSFYQPPQLPMRPPNMCPGCPHRGLFYVLSRLGLFVSGDIGCYTLGALKPLSAMDSCICMGASVGNAHGMEKTIGEDAVGKIVAVIGDSTFVHSGITGLIDIVYNRGCSTVIILDNRTTAMTGHQPNPVMGKTIRGEDTNELDIAALCRAIGIKNVVETDPHDIDLTYQRVKREVEKREPSVIITKAPCALLPEVRRLRRPSYEITLEKCTGCRACLSIGCPAISWVSITEEEAERLGFKKKQKGYSRIDQILCNGCGQCSYLCKFKAIGKAGE